MNIKLLSGGSGGRGRGYSGAFTGGILTQKITITHTEFQTAGLTFNKTLWALPAGAIVIGSRLKASATWQGGAIANYYLSIGISGALQQIMTEYDAMNIVIGNTEYAESFLFESFNYGASVDLKVAARSVGANLSASTQGTALVEIFYLPKV